MTGSPPCWPGEADARRFVEFLFDEPGRVVEVRIPKPKGRRGAAAGYFDDPEKLVAAVARGDGRADACYVTLNPINPALLARAANAIRWPIEATTADADVLRRRWLLVDLDPVRPSGVSASEAEHEAALARAKEVRHALAAEGFPEPVLGDSGNGAHLLYRVDLPLEDGGLLKRMLEALAFRFGDDQVAVDRAVYNAARISKLYGTLAAKGDSTPARPHRRSRLISVPEAVAVVSREALERIAAQAPRPPEPARTPRGRREPTDVPAILARHGLEVAREGEWNGGRRWVLRVCPFDTAHADCSAYIVQFASGAVAAGCHHGGCAGKGWADLRALYEPERGRGSERRPPSDAAPGPPSAPGRASGDGGRPAIFVSEDVERVVNEAEAALLVAARGRIYQRAGLLARVIRDAAPRLKALRRPAGAPTISQIPAAHLLELMASAAAWVKPARNEDDPPRPTLPPLWAVEALLARGEWRFPPIEGLVEAPLLRSDGSVLDQPGYDPATGLLFEAGNATFEPVQEEPSVNDAQRAREDLHDVLADFPFAAESDRSAAMSMLLTPLARFATDGPVPLFAIRAPAPGTGKSLLADVAAVLATGRVAPRLTQPRDDEEERKAILALGLEGASIVLIDNVERPLGSAALAAALTGRTFTARLLGSNRTVTVPMSATWIATGNNLVVKGDLGRRIVPIDLDAKVERPESRTGFRHANLLAYVRAERGRLVRAALTILRAFLVHATEEPRLEPYGSFEAWSSLVRAALVWLGEPDPCAGRKRIREEGDPELEALRVALAAWHGAIGPEPLTIGALLTRAAANASLRAALGGLDLRGDPDRLDPRRLGYVLRRHRGRIVDGRCLQSGRKTEAGIEWTVVEVNVRSADDTLAMADNARMIVSQQTQAPRGSPDGADDHDDGAYPSRVRACAYVRARDDDRKDRQASSVVSRPPENLFGGAA